ncbi:MAG: HAD family hydrolase [Clostridia bacterium]|nr:HAD family hydrolase [Clostridia bacterium]
MNLYLFDMDGTLVNSINSISYFANKALNKYGLSSIPVQRYKFLVGSGAGILVKRMISETGGDMSLYDKIFKEYVSLYDSNFLYLTQAYDGIEDFLKELKKRGNKIAIVSNKPHSTAQKISDTLFGGELIDICFGKKDGYPIKPDPTAVNEVINILNFKKSDCLYFGDTITDMQTGKNAGIYTVGVLWGFRDEKELLSGNPDKIINNTYDILNCTI